MIRAECTCEGERERERMDHLVVAARRGKSYSVITSMSLSRCEEEPRKKGERREIGGERARRLKCEIGAVSSTV